MSKENEQKVFDRVLDHLRTQGEPAMTVNCECRYRTQREGKTLSCAVGCLIPDEVYDPSIECAIVQAFRDAKLPEKDQFITEEIPGETLHACASRVAVRGVLDALEVNYGLLAEMQGIHDSAAVRARRGASFVAHVNASFKALAERRGLTYTKQP